MVLLLSSLSLQTAALQGRRRDASQFQRRAAQDGLASAAQVVAGQLQQDYPCLVSTALREWDARNTCNPGGNLDELTKGTLSGSDEGLSGIYTVENYQIVGDKAALDLLWQPSQARARSTRQRFWLTLSPPPTAAAMASDQGESGITMLPQVMGIRP